MSQDERVVVRGGGKNLYKISEHAGRFHVYHVEVGLIRESQFIELAKHIITYIMYV